MPRGGGPAQCRVGCPPALDFRCWRDGAESGPRERAMGMWDGRAEGSGMEDKERDGGRGLEIRERKWVSGKAGWGKKGIWETKEGREVERKYCTEDKRMIRGE